MTPPPKPPARLAADVARPLALSGEARALLRPDVAPRGYLDLLAAAGLVPDALQFLAAALPKPEAVWWGHGCALAAIHEPSPAAARALAAARRWAAEQTEAARLAARDAAEGAGWDTAPGCLAGAAWLASGSLSPAGLPVVAPRDDLTGRAVGGAVELLLALDPARRGEVAAGFLALGRAVAAGESRPG